MELDLSGPRVRLEGLSAAVAETAGSEWSAFLTSPAEAEPLLHLHAAYESREVPEEAWAPKSMRSEVAPERASFGMAEGRAEVDASGRADVVLARGLGPREFYTLANLVRACVAWRMPARGGLLLHAAGLVLEGRAHLLVGPESSGKSTWARLGEGAGGRVISDDLVLVDGAGERLEVLGSPFRSTHVADYRPGRCPLASVLFPRHGTTPRLQPVSDLLATARLTANLPFVSEAIAVDERIAAALRRVVRTVRCAELTFAPEPSFVELLSDGDAPVH